jgi:carbonic anhydrase
MTLTEDKKNGTKPQIDLSSVKLAQSDTYEALLKGNSDWVKTTLIILINLQKARTRRYFG